MFYSLEEIQYATNVDYATRFEFYRNYQGRAFTNGQITFVPYEIFNSPTGFRVSKSIDFDEFSIPYEKLKSEFKETILPDEPPIPKIRELRIESGMTQQAFADFFDIPKRTIENWEGSKSNAPEYLIKLIEYKLKNERLI